MLQANPALTPNLVKAILQYTAETSADYDPLTQGAGFLNARGAVALARHLASPLLVPYPSESGWSRQLIWGNYRVTGGRLAGSGNAWSTGVTWGATATSLGLAIRWGVTCLTSGCQLTTSWRWRSDTYANVVWGGVCGGDNCSSPWSLEAVSPANDDGDTVVWGTDENGDTVVWGTDEDGDTVVWGTDDDGDTVVWGTSCSDPACEPVIWPGQ
jgi:hypothetical protein